MSQGIDSGTAPGGAARPVIIASNFPAVGQTGVHTHIRQWRGYLEQQGMRVSVITPFTWNQTLAYPAFAPRLALRYVNKPASLMWYRRWHEEFLCNGLRRELARAGDCVIYAQGPVEASAALRARQGKHQCVIMAVHFRGSQADEHAEPGREIRRDGPVYGTIRQFERDVIMRLDGMVYVSQWARDALLGWLPEAASVRSAVIGNAVAPIAAERCSPPRADLVTVGRLDQAKNHRFILNVLAEAKKMGRIITLDIFGDGPLRTRLQRQISSLKLTGQARLLGFQADVRALLPSYRAYVHASYLETSSLAIIEAMAAGLPIVAGSIGAIPELCSDGAEARFWPLDDPARAAAILIELVESEQAMSTAAELAQLRFQQEFDVNVVGPRMARFLRAAGGSDDDASSQGVATVASGLGVPWPPARRGCRTCADESPALPNSL